MHSFNSSKKLCNLAAPVRSQQRPPLNHPSGRLKSQRASEKNNHHQSEDLYLPNTRTRPPTRWINKHTNDTSSPTRSQKSPPSTASTTTTTWTVLKEYFLRRKYAGLKPNECARILTDEMKQFFTEYQKARPDVYWHRKSGQVVLAVLLVHFKGAYRITRGINSELSLPSGTVCAERAAITAALSQYLEISRNDFLAIAVFSPNQPNPIRPCGVCKEWLTKIEEASPTFTVISFTSNQFDEILEYCPIPFLEEVFGDIPSDLREPAWTCKCGYRSNGPKQAYCALCKQSRFKFKRRLHNNRIRVLNAIAMSSGYPFRDRNHKRSLLTTPAKYTGRRRSPQTLPSHQKQSLAVDAVHSDGSNEWEDEPDGRTAQEGDDEMATNGIARSNSSNIFNGYTSSLSISFAAKIASLSNISENAAAKILRDLVSLQFVSPNALANNERAASSSSVGQLQASSDDSCGELEPVVFWQRPTHDTLLTKAGVQFLLSIPCSRRQTFSSRFYPR